MSPTIHDLLAAHRATSQTEREKGTYFEKMISNFSRYESAAPLHPNTFPSNANRI